MMRTPTDTRNRAYSDSSLDSSHSEQSTCPSIPSSCFSEDTGTPLLPLLFGIDIETLVRFPYEPEVTRLQNFCELNDEASDILIKHFKSYRLTLGYEDDARYTYETWKAVSDLSIRPNPGVNLPLIPSFFDADGKEKKSAWGGVELVSPPMQALSLTKPPDSQHAWVEAAAVFEALTDPAAPMVAFQSRSCGLHVHVGLPEYQSFDLPLLKELAQLVLVYEPVVNRLHPPHRTPGPYTGSHAIRFGNSNRIGVRTDRHSCKDDKLTVAEIRRRVQNCDTVDELVCLLSACVPLGDDLRTRRSDEGHNYEAVGETIEDFDWEMPPPSAKYRIVNFINLHSRRSRNIRTIEFRQPAGTNDGREAAHVVQLCLAFVRAAERRIANIELNISSAPQVTDAIDPNNPGLEDLFRTFQLCPQAESFWRERYIQMTKLREEVETSNGVAVGSCYACYEAMLAS